MHRLAGAPAAHLLGPGVGEVEGPQAEPAGEQRGRDERVAPRAGVGPAGAGRGLARGGAGRRPALRDGRVGPPAAKVAEQPRTDPGRGGEAEHEHRHGSQQLAGHGLQVRQDRREREGDLAGRVARREGRAVDEPVEGEQTGREERDRGQPDEQRAARHGGRPVQGDDGGDGDGQLDHVGVAHGHGAVDGEEAEQADDQAAPRARVAGEHRPEQAPRAGRDQRGVAERRHGRAPGKDERGARGAVERHAPDAPPATQPAPGADEQPGAGERAEKERRDPQDAEQVEDDGEERIARVLLADPEARGEAGPLRDALAAARGEPAVERLVLGRGQGEMAVREGHDRGAIRVVVGFEHLRALRQHDGAEDGEDEHGDDDLGPQARPGRARGGDGCPAPVHRAQYAEPYYEGAEGSLRGL